MQQFIYRLDNIFIGRNTKPSSCLSNNNNSDILLEDSKILGKTVFLTQEVDNDYASKNCFVIKNPEQKDIFLWAIDGCFVGNGRPLSATYTGKCDCAFGYENYIGFVEFKLDADPAANPRTIETNRKKAINQIENMICFLRDNLGINGFFRISGYTIEAYLCTPVKYPNKNTSITDLALEFLETYGVPIFEKSDKECI